MAPKGSDTQPAELPSGSFVVNKDSAQANPALLDQLGAATVPNVPGQVAAFTDQAALTTPAGPGQADQAAAAAAMLTPGERVVPPAVASAHPEVAQVNAAHGPVEGDPLAPPGSLSGGLNPMPEYHEGGGPVGDVPHLDQGGDIARRFRDPTGTGWTGTPAAASPSWSTIAAPAAGGSAGPLGVMPVKIVAPLPVPVTLSQGLPTGVGPAGQKTQPTDNGLPGVLGKLQKTVAEMGTPWKDLDASMGKLIVGAAAASVALHQMLQAASPEAWRTLQGSFTILAQSLGRYLIEPALKLSYAVQYLAHWVRSLDPGVMRLAGNVAFWTTVVLAGVSAIRVFGGWLVSTIGFVAGLGRGLLSLITGTTSATAATAAASSGMESCPRHWGQPRRQLPPPPRACGPWRPRSMPWRPREAQRRRPPRPEALPDWAAPRPGLPVPRAWGALPREWEESGPRELPPVQLHQPRSPTARRPGPASALVAPRSRLRRLWPTWQPHTHGWV